MGVDVRNDRPLGGQDPPATLFYASHDRTAEHAERHLDNRSSLLHADACGGYSRPNAPERKPGGSSRRRVRAFFSKTMRFRHIATRFDKLAEHFLSALKLASIRIRLHGLGVHDPKLLHARSRDFLSH